MKYISFIAALALLVTGTQSCIVRIDKNNALEMVRLFNERTIKGQRSHGFQRNQDWKLSSTYCK